MYPTTLRISHTGKFCFNPNSDICIASRSSSLTIDLLSLSTKMGTSFNKAIFVEPVLEGIDGWAQRAHRNKDLRKATNGSRQVGPKEPSPAAIQMVQAAEKESEVEEGNTIEAGEIKPAR